MAEKIRVHAKTSETKQKCLNSCKQNSGFNSSGSSADRILQLQRTAGNQAVQRLIKSGALQAKLKVGQPNDIYEQEADRVAEQVMRMPEPQASNETKAPKRNTDNPIQRKCPECKLKKEEEEKILQAKEISGSAPEVTPELEASISAVRGGGQPLPESTRAFFEPRFGQDFSRVRIHTDANAAESARAMNAMAFIIGHDISFGTGKYDHRTHNDKLLLAHELTHTIQQEDTNYQRDMLNINGVNDAYERNSKSISNVVVLNKIPNVPIMSTAAKLQRQTLDTYVNKGKEEEKEVDSTVHTESEYTERQNTLNERLVTAAIKEMDENMNITNSGKVLVQIFIIAKQKGILKKFGLDLLARSHAEYGSYLNYFLIILRVKFSENMINLIINDLAKAGLIPLKTTRNPNDTGSTDIQSATGGGIGSVLAYQGKTLVQIGGENFYISGVPPEGVWIPPKGTTSVFFIYKKDNPKKMYRLDYDVLKKGPKAGTKGWEHNQKGVKKVLGITVDNHQPAGGWGKVAGVSILIFKWGGRSLFVIGSVASAIEIYYALDWKRAAAKVIGGTGGAIAGVAGGTAACSKIPAPPLIKGGAVLICGAAGGYFGGKAGAAAAQFAYDLIITPLEKEEWIMLTEDQVEPSAEKAAPSAESK
jgi:rubredoxin